MVLGFDIGGTKCAVITVETDGDNIRFTGKEKIPTELDIAPEEMIKKLIGLADGMLGGKRPEKIGISCGGPLNSSTGTIEGPPNLPGWNNVKITDILEKHYGVCARLENDANACAVAEWKFGAGRGAGNMVFLTFGTGLGAGLILNGRLYSGTNDNAGEVGHIRLDRFGPVGYGKSGSFEGFCSGGGLAQLGYIKALEKSQSGIYPSYFKKGMTVADVTAKTVADAADAGDETAIEVYRICAEQLGRGLSVLIDIINPEKIVIGSIFARSENLIRESMEKIIREEALPQAAGCCKVVSALLGERIGDYAAVATALL